MANNNENPAAFPRLHATQQVPQAPPINHAAQTGMTLLDYFAGQALAGMLADPAVTISESVAVSAYKVATFMLQERQKRLDAEK